MREGSGEQDQLPVDGPKYPRAVHIAGVIWIIFGSLILLNAAINLLLTVGMAAGDGAQAAGGGSPVWIGVLVGAVFIHVGVQSTRGTAKDTLGNGIGSLIFGLLNGGFGAFLIVGAIAAGGIAGLIAAIFGGISLLGGIGLLVAGVLALVGREEYKAWRRAQKSRAGSGVATPKEILSPDDYSNYRDIRAVSLLFMLLGIILMFGGIGIALDEQRDSRERIHPALAVACAIVGLAGAVGGIIALRGNRRWSKLVYVMAAVYILAFPIGTILSYVRFRGFSRYLHAQERFRAPISKGIE
jgi:hypothetical protein